mgnify:FL=1
MKNLFYALFVLLVSVSLTYGGCGSCNVSNQKATTPSGNFIINIGEKGVVNGLVLASCGMCNFGMKNKRGCSLAIQINDIAYDVKGTDIDDHGDSHAKNGFCNAIRVAQVKGKIKKNIFISDSFIIQKK